MKFTLYNNTQIELDELDVHSEIAKDLEVGRSTAKLAFWNFVMGSTNVKLGEILSKSTIEKVKSEDVDYSDIYYLTGKIARPILNHYALEWFKVLASQEKISFTNTATVSYD